ncbi:WASH complex subunit 4 isoform X2 [Cephus cinctus]|uniref:WASH complex subunit 4 isoform X2 n=1 Tax=Cephus cinctus TaxID=211228 RepID=A0AAJ7BHI0_CEPCN|nr:WASH complex subunit 4 isoform X2 [Cephus cinctus]
MENGVMDLMQKVLECFYLIYRTFLYELIDANPAILDQWEEYRLRVRSFAHNPEQFNVTAGRLSTFEKVLKDLKDQLLKKNLFIRTLDSSMEINKSSIMYDHIVTYLKNTMTDIEGKFTDVLAVKKKWVRISVGVMVVSKLFGNTDKKLIKRIWEVSKKFYGVTLVGNIFWVPSKFLFEFFPKECGSFISTQVGEKILWTRTTSLPTVTNNLVQKAMSWCTEMSHILRRTSTKFRIVDLERKRNLLVELVSLMAEIRENVEFITNTHAALGKPMNRFTVNLVCRLVEVQKTLETSFHVLGALIVQSQIDIVQHLSYQILALLETTKKRLLQKDKSYNRERLDALSLIGLSIRLINGPATVDRRLIARCALVCASQITENFREDEVIKLRNYLDQYDTIVDLDEQVNFLCDYSILLHHQSMLPAYLNLVTDSNLNISHIVQLLSAFNSALEKQEPTDLTTAKISEQRNILKKNVLEPACREIETSLRLHVHAHLKLDDANPFEIGAKDGTRIIRSSPLPLAENMICAKRFVEHYLDDMFYNLTTVAPHDWRTYDTMHQLAKYKLGLDTVQNHLPTQTLDQGLDALEIMRNIHVFVSKYSYNLNTQTFIERTSANKHLNTIGIRHIENSIRTHGTGIMSTTVNFVYQFLRIKLHTFSQFLFDEHIKSRLMRDIRFIKTQRENSATPYTYERAEKFQKGIRNLGMTPDGLSYLDQFRQLITQIGNALGYVRLIRSGGQQARSNAISFLPDINSSVFFENLCKSLNYSETTQAAAKRLEEDISNLVRNFTEGIEYFKLLVDVFASSFRDAKSSHLQQFYAIIPPLTLSFVDNAVSSKEKLFKKNKTGAAFTDDGFAMGIAYINALLDQSAELDGLQWFDTVEQQISSEKILAKSKDDQEDIKLQQTRALTLKRLEDRNAEFQLLYYSLSGARVFFKQSDS